MKFFKRATAMDACDTWLQGRVRAKFDDLVRVFGKPDPAGDKTNAEWVLRFNDGTIATIYDWKRPCIPIYYYDWHIGGTTPKAVRLVEEALADATADLPQ